MRQRASVVRRAARPLTVLAVWAACTLPASPATAHTVDELARQAADPATPAVPAPAGPAAAGQAGAQAPVAPGEEPPPGVGLSRAVAALDLVSPDLDEVRRELRLIRDERDAASARRDEIVPELTLVADELRSLHGVLDRRQAQVDKAASGLARARNAVNEVAVEWFITGFGALEGLDPALTGEDRERLSHQFVLSEAGAYAALADERHLAARLAELQAERNSFERRRGELAAREERLGVELAELTAGLDDAARRIPELERQAQHAAMLARVAGTDMSAIALDAYWRAERVLALVDPTCGVRWWTLAGIGRTESLHGTYRGSTLSPDGMVAPPIYGPHLDGSLPFAVVADSDDGALDGVATTDRAVGPMQFLPSTWRMVGIDATDDGVADPQNLFDAAASAGVYLCRSGPGLEAEERLRRALLTYNRSLPYVQIVLERGLAYGAATGLR